jgi:hypothetical protein
MLKKNPRVVDFIGILPGLHTSPVSITYRSVFSPVSRDVIGVQNTPKQRAFPLYGSFMSKLLQSQQSNRRES